MFGDTVHIKCNQTGATPGSQERDPMVALASKYAGRLYQTLFPSTPKSNQAPVASSKAEVEEVPFVRERRRSAEADRPATSSMAWDFRRSFNSKFESAQTSFQASFNSTLGTIQELYHAAVDPIVNSYNRRYNTFRRSAPVAGFDAFVKEKSEKKGFSVADKLRFAYVDYKEAQGFAKVLAWFNLGGLGALVAGNFNERSSAFEKLKAQADFYKNVCKAENAFAKFNKKPDAAKYEAAVKAFEVMLADEHRGSNTAFADMNVILNNQLGADVARVLIEYGAAQALKKGGTLTQEDLLDTFRAQSFFNTIEELEHKGYRPEITSAEKARLEFLYPNGAKNSQFNLLLREENAPIFMAYNRVFNSIMQPELLKAGLFNKAKVKAQADSIEARNLTVLKTIQHLDGDVDAQVDYEMKRNNTKLFEFVQSAPQELDAQSTRFGVSGKTLNEMVETYNNYQAAKERLLNAGALQSVAAKNLQDAQTGLEAFKKAQKEYTFEELTQLYGENPDRTLPGASLYLAHKSTVVFHTSILTEANKNITDRVKEINTYLNGNGLGMEGLATTGAIEEMKVLQQRVVETKAIVESTHKEKQRLMDQIANRKVDAFQVQSAVTAAEQAQVLDLTTKHDRALTDYNSFLGMFNYLQSLVKIHQEELKQLEGNNSKHDLVKARDSANKQLVVTNTLKIGLSNGMIMTIPDNQSNLEFTKIRVNGAKLNKTIVECTSKLAECNKELTNAPKALAQYRNRLSGFGFIFKNDEVVGLNYKFDQDAMKKSLTSDSEVTGLVFALLRDVNKSTKALLDEHALIKRAAQQAEQQQNKDDQVRVSLRVNEEGGFYVERPLSYLPLEDDAETRYVGVGGMEQQ